MKSLGLCHKTCKTCMSSMASIIRIRAVQLVLEASLRETCTEGHNFLMPKGGAVPTSNGFRCVEVFRCTQRKSSFFWWHGVMCSKLTHLKWAYNFPWHDFQRNFTLWKGSTRWKVLGHGGMADESSKGVRILMVSSRERIHQPKQCHFQYFSICIFWFFFWIPLKILKQLGQHWLALRHGSPKR